jgi:hypothetical protein
MLRVVVELTPVYSKLKGNTRVSMMSPQGSQDLTYAFRAQRGPIALSLGLRLITQLSRLYHSCSEQSSLGE